MMRTALITIILFFSCSQKTKVPDTVLPPPMMERLLMDMLRAEELLNSKQGDSTLGDSINRISLYNSVLASHKTDKESFERSFIYYENHPNLLKPVLDSMYQKANKKTDTLNLPPKLRKNLKK
jgi:hypothetical protein